MYQGTWAADLPHGLGQCRFADGSVYRGPFVRGRMHGRGVLLNFDATVAFDGEWRDGERYHQAYPSLPRPLHPWRNGQRRFRSSLSLTRPHRALTGGLLGHIHVSAVGTERPHSTRRSRTTRSQCVVMRHSLRCSRRPRSMPLLLAQRSHRTTRSCCRPPPPSHLSCRHSLYVNSFLPRCFRFPRGQSHLFGVT